MASLAIGNSWLLVSSSSTLISHNGRLLLAQSGSVATRGLKLSPDREQLRGPTLREAGARPRPGRPPGPTGRAHSASCHGRTRRPPPGPPVPSNRPPRIAGPRALLPSPPDRHGGYRNGSLTPFDAPSRETPRLRGPRRLRRLDAWCVLPAGATVTGGAVHTRWRMTPSHRAPPQAASPPSRACSLAVFLPPTTTHLFMTSSSSSSS